jgi:bis(5'-nucleosidyl)-tetraphosphatase
MRFLMLRAFNHWDFPKGMVEPGEQPKQAALREVREETTVSDLEFPWGNIYFETGPYNHGKIARYYIATTRQAMIELPVNPEIGRAEHSEYRWVSLQQARGLSSPRVRQVIDWAALAIGLEPARGVHSAG